MTNSPLGKLIRHPIDVADAEMKLSQLKLTFGAICNFDKPDVALSLWPFCETRPLRYFNRDTFRTYLSFLENDIGAALDGLTLHGSVTSQAIYTVFRPTESWNVESQQQLSKPKDFLRFDRLWHPEYQRYAEHAFNHLTRVPLEILQKNAGKNFQALELANRADKLREHDLGSLVSGFNPCLRNAISHGGVHYGDGDIRYVSRNKEEILWANRFLEQLDSLVDTCSAYIAALLAFICRNFETVQGRGIENLPDGVRFLLLRGLCFHPGFDVEGLLTISHNSTSGLNLYCRSKTRSHQVHCYEALHAATQLHYLGVRSGVISINIECGASFPSYLIVNGEGLTEALADHAPSETLVKVIQANLLWHNTNALGRWFYVFSTIMVSTFKQSLMAMKKQWRDAGLKCWKDRYTIRHVENLSVGQLRRVVAEIVIKDEGDLKKDEIKSIICHATKYLKRQRVCGKDRGRLLFVRLRPSYVTIHIHFGEERIRQLQRSRFDNPNFLATSEWISIFRRHNPIWVKKPDENFHGIRVRWNPINAKQQTTVSS